MLSTHNADVYTDFSGLAQLKNQAKKESPDALKEAAKQFEAIFLNNILKGMRQSKLADGAMDNEQSKFYNEMYDQQLALHLSGSNGGIGFADLIVKQLSPRHAETEKKPVADFQIQSITPPPPPAAVRAFSADVSEPDPKHIMINAYPYRDTPLKTMVAIPFQAQNLKSDETLPINSPEDFIKQLHPYAQEAAAELGVEPKLLLAQAALETGWGRSVIQNSNGSSSFNLYNIKADKSWQGNQTRIATIEFDQGIAKKVNSGFRSYGSFKESFQDYVQFIKSNPRYADALKKAGNAQQYIRELQQAGYATDPKYTDKVMGIYQGNTMNAFAPAMTLAMN